jgi:hypothetical protein
MAVSGTLPPRRLGVFPQVSNPPVSRLCLRRVLIPSHSQRYDEIIADQSNTFLLCVALFGTHALTWLGTRWSTGFRAVTTAYPVEYLSLACHLYYGRLLNCLLFLGCLDRLRIARQSGSSGPPRIWGVCQTRKDTCKVLRNPPPQNSFLIYKHSARLARISSGSVINATSTPIRPRNTRSLGSRTLVTNRRPCRFSKHPLGCALRPTFSSPRRIMARINSTFLSRPFESYLPNTLWRPSLSFSSFASDCGVWTNIGITGKQIKRCTVLVWVAGSCF